MSEVETEHTEHTEEENGTEEESTRKRKLDRVYDPDKGELKLKVLGFDEEYTVHSLDALTPEIRKQCELFGLSQKLGDACGGKFGEDAREAIDTQWEQLLSGDFTTRVQGDGVNKRSKEALSRKIEGLSDAEREDAKKLFEKMGITI